MDENRMGLCACIAYVVGNVVGSGIFITPTGVLAKAGSVGLALVIWLVCGLISLLGGVAFIELGTGIPSDGGDFAYATFVGWKAVAFAFMVVSALLTFPASTAVQCTTFGYYLVNGLEEIISVPAGSAVYLQYGFAITLLFVCSFLNGYSVRQVAGVFQMGATVAKIVILLFVFVVGIVWVFVKDSQVTAENVFEGSDFAPTSLVLAAYGGLWSFAGWDILNYGAPAVKNPRRTLPLALIGGLILVTVLYVATNLSFSVVLGKEAMLASSAVAADFAEVSIGKFAVAIPFATAILLIGSVNANIFCTSSLPIFRIILEAAKEGHLCAFLGAQHKASSSPRAALIFQFLVAAIFTFIEVETLINYVSFVIFAQKAVTIAALFVMRRKKMKMHPDVMRIPLPFAFIFFLICIVLVTIPVLTEFWMTFWGAVGVLCSLVIYYFFVKKGYKIYGYDKFQGWILRMLKTYFDSEFIYAMEEEPSAEKSLAVESGRTAASEASAADVVPPAEEDFNQGLLNESSL